MRVLFIDVPGAFPASPEIRGNQLSQAIALLSAALIRHGHCVSVLDMMNHYENTLPDSIVRSLQQFQPEAICFSVLSVQYAAFLEAVRVVRANSGVPIIAGGAGIACAKDKVFNETKFAVDVIVPGEGENVLLQILECLEKQESDKLLNIKGLLFNHHGQIIDTGSTGICIQPDDYPRQRLDVFGIRSMGTYFLMASRGCPYHCVFCYQHTGRVWRSRSPQKIVEELVEAFHKYNFRKFVFLDAFLNKDSAWLIELCERISHSDIKGIPWTANGLRADHLTEEICEAMVAAGCEQASIGVESLHPEVFRLCRKGTTLEKMKAGIRLAVKYFPKTVCFMIIGLPGDTLERTLFSYREIKKLKPGELLFCMAVHFPGTALETFVSQHAHELHPPTASLLINTSNDLKIAFETPEFTEEERKLAFNIIKTKELTYISWISLLQPKTLLPWLKYAVKYDTLHIFRHLVEVVRQEIRLHRLRKSPQSFTETVEYERIPNGTWGICNKQSQIQH